MTDLNKWTGIGRLTRDPELAQVGSGTSLCKFGIALNRKYTVQGEKREEAHFFNCTAWGKQADILAQYARKGKQIAIEGRLAYRSWDGPDGKKQSAIDIVVENFQFLGSKQSEQGESPEPSPQNFPDDDIPF